MERISIIGRIKGLLALHGIWLVKKNISKGLRQRLDAMKTGDGRPLAPFLRSEIERMLTRYDLISRQIADVEADRKAALNNEKGVFPHADKVRRLTTLGAVGETTATVLVAEIYHRTFLTRRQVASFVGLAPSPYNSGEVDRDRGIKFHPDEFSGLKASTGGAVRIDLTGEPAGLTLIPLLSVGPLACLLTALRASAPSSPGLAHRRA